MRNLLWSGWSEDVLDISGAVKMDWKSKVVKLTLQTI